MIINFYFIRHAESEYNAGISDDVDSLLTQKGKIQAKALGGQLLKEGVNFTDVFVSTATRTQETAEIVLEILNYQGVITIDSQIVEQNYGIDRNNKNKWYHIPKDGESPYMVADRMINRLQREINYDIESPGTRNIAVFSHGLAIKYMLLELLNLNRSSEIKISNTGVTILSFFDGKLQFPILRMNDISHLNYS